MHDLFPAASARTAGIIGAAIEVHKTIGPGLLESIYEWALMKELTSRGHKILEQSDVTIQYKQYERNVPLRYDLLIDSCLLVEIKAVEQILPIHKAQLLTYMKLLDIPLGLVINFHEIKLVDGVSRLILPGADNREKQ